MVESEEDTVKRYESQVRNLARKFADAGELAQVGRLELLLAYRLWRTKEQRTDFWPYARKAVLGEMLNHVGREHDRIKKEMECDLLPGKPPCPSDVLEAKEHMDSLPYRESLVVGMFLDGYTAEEVGACVGVSRARVYQLLDSSFQAIRKRA